MRSLSEIAKVGRVSLLRHRYCPCISACMWHSYSLVFKRRKGGLQKILPLIHPMIRDYPQ